MLPSIVARETRPARFLLVEEIVDHNRSAALSDSERNALRAVAEWIDGFVARPNRDLGRAGPVCPFAPRARRQKTLWLAAERGAGLSAAEAIQLIESHKRALLGAQPVEGDDVDYKSIAVVFPDLPAGRAEAFFGAILQQIAIPSYDDEGLVMGPFYEGNEGTAIYNPNFRPFNSPVPFLLIRRAVISDWKFFLSDEAWLGRWAGRYGEAAVTALADQLRSLPWRSGLVAPQ